jgi:hypothetical protein
MKMNSNNQKYADDIKPVVDQRIFKHGFWLLMLSYSVLGLSKTRWQIESQYIVAPLLCVAMYILLLTSLQDWRSRLTRFDPNYQIIFYFLLLWGTITAIRGFTPLGLTSIRDNLGIRYFAWTWFIPALMLLSVDVTFIKQLLLGTAKHGRLGIIILAIGWIPPIRLFTFFSLCWGCSALLLFWHHLSKGGRRVAIIGAFLTVFFAVLNSERNAIIGHGFLMICASYISMKRQDRFKTSRRMSVIMCCLVVLGLVYYSATHNDLFFLSEKAQIQVNHFKEEIFQNTRISKSGVSLYQDMLNDMDTVDLIIGRGATGRYRSMESGGQYRPVIECGYFHVILKGGFIMLFLMLALAIPAVLKGLFGSRNLLVKGFAFIVLGWLIEMVPFGVPAAFPRYALFWIAIGVCLNPRLRSMTDEEIATFLPEKSVQFGPNSY